MAKKPRFNMHMAAGHGHPSKTRQNTNVQPETMFGNFWNCFVQQFGATKHAVEHKRDSGAHFMLIHFSLRGQDNSMKIEMNGTTEADKEKLKQHFLAYHSKVTATA